jgi:hypothetical protein
MQCSTRNALLLIILVSLCLACSLVWAEEGVLVVEVTDVQSHPVPGLRIGVEGSNSTPGITDRNGKTRIRLAPGTKPGSLVSLAIMNSPGGEDLEIISPFAGRRATVPPFDNESENYVLVVVVRRGDIKALRPLIAERE